MGGRALIAGAAVLWSLGGVLIKILNQAYGVQPEALACLRSAAAALALISWVPAIGPAPYARIGLAGIAYAVVVGSFVKASTDTTAANAIFLQYFYPLLVAIGAKLFFSEPGDARSRASILLGTAGVAVILAGTWQGGFGGVGYGLASAVGFAGFVLIMHGVKTGSPLAMASIHNIIAAAALIPFAYGTFDLPWPALLLIAAMGVLQLGLPYAMFMQGLKTVPATEAALITLLEPVLNPVWVWLVVGEVPSAWTLGGGALILAALAWRLTGPRSSRA
jgi:drug/metabolite transporter (DMT)-like permease